MIKIDNLDFSYKRQKVFDKFSLRMESGRVYGLLGTNGAGKTTLLKILAGLLYPNSGNVSVLGHQPKYREPKLLSEIIMTGEGQYVPNMSIKQFVRMYAPFYPNFDGALCEELMDEFKLSYDHQLRKLSFGEKKKVNIAFALATKCKVLLMDEPTNGLDIPSKRQFRQIMARTIQDDCLIIISTHQVKDIEGLVDTISLIEKGNLLLQASLDKIMEKLSFSTYFNEPAAGEVLYKERIPGGYICLEENTTQEFTQEIDLEILFNAINSNPEAILSIIQTPDSK